MSETSATRREFVATVGAAAVVLPLLGAATGEERAAMAAGENWVATVKPEALADGTAKVYKADGFILSRVGQTIYALDTMCTHNQCAVKPGVDRKDKEKNLLACPCHGARYDATGAVAQGPAKKPLARRAVRLGAGGVIEVNAGAKLAAGAAEGALKLDGASS